MRWLLVAIFLGACTSSGAPSRQLGAHAFDPHSFTVGIFNSVSADGSAASALTVQLPDAWSKATAGKSSLHVTTDPPDVYIVMGDEPPTQMPGGIQSAWNFVAPPLRFVYLHRGGPNATLETVHELGHVLLCCAGAPNAGPDGHWEDCPTPPIEIMCHFQGSATTFSPRELRAMGLN